MSTKKPLFFFGDACSKLKMRGPGGSIANMGRFSPIGCEIDAVMVPGTPGRLAEAPKIPVDIPWLPDNELPSTGGAALLAKREFGWVD